jgi:sarcosine oxidase / L-pipecolate oxidase
MSTSTIPPTKILIVGAGVFGLSTALSLLQRPTYTKSYITVLDASPTLPNPHGSSVDASRIVRADYAQAPYAALAVQAQLRWRDSSDAGWGGQGRYHQPGFLLTADKGEEAYLRACMANVRELAEQGLPGLDVGMVEELGDQEAIRRASGFEGVSGDRGYVNWSSGWADAEACVRYVLDRLRREGKGRVDVRGGAVVRRLLYEERKADEEKSRCVGAELENGEMVLAELVIVAAGAWSPTLVNLQGRVVATGQTLAYLNITEEEQRAMERRPTIMNMSQGTFIIPPRGRELKIARHGFGYRNLRRIPRIDGASDSNLVNGQIKDGGTVEVSVPAVGIEIPVEAQEVLREALRKVAPESAGIAIRTCSPIFLDFAC